jgi:hypothetical protein
MRQVFGEDHSVLIIIGQTTELGHSAVGEDDVVQNELRGSAPQRAAWMAKEQFIATVRMAASRKMRIWIAQDCLYSSLAALILSEYLHPNVAERGQAQREDPSHGRFLLNLFRTKEKIRAPRNISSWIQTYSKIGVLNASAVAPTLLAVIEEKRPKLIVCIGTGPKVSFVTKLAKKNEVSIARLDLSRDRSALEGDNGFESRIRSARANMRMYRAKSERDTAEHERDFATDRPLQLHMFPPVPLLVHWQLDQLLPYG